MTFHIITLFPESFSYLNESIIGRAQKKKLITFKFYNPRDFTTDKHRITDDKTYGGGPGMVLKAEPILKAIKKAIGRKRNVKVIFFAISGKQLNASIAKKFAKQYKDIVLIAGHYEGVDERVVKMLKPEKISVGHYVLTGGELPAMVVADAVSRHIPGVLGKKESLEESRIASSEVYTRPEVLLFKEKKYRVPKVLLSGNHKKIEEWRTKRK